MLYYMHSTKQTSHTSILSCELNIEDNERGEIWNPNIYTINSTVMSQMRDDKEQMICYLNRQLTNTATPLQRRKHWLQY